MVGAGVVPFEEDEKDPRTWYLDHNYIESMNDMFKKVNGSSPPLPRPPLTHSLTKPCSEREVDRLVPYWTEATSFRSRDQRGHQEVFEQTGHGHRGCQT